MYELPDTCSVTEFRDHIADHLRTLRTRRKPTLLTQNGRAAAVVMSPREFEAYAAAREFMDVVQAIEAGRDDVKSGRVEPWPAVRQRLLARVTKPATRKSSRRT